MAEPIPSASAGDHDEEAPKAPTNAEDRKAAAALDALNANAMSQENGESASKQPSAADQEALGKAMSRLEVASGAGKKTEDTNKKSETKKEAEVKKKIKLSADDVNFLVAQLDLSKPKASDLLRSHDGSLDQAVRAFMTPAVKA